jgi:hypothetical protein
MHPGPPLPSLVVVEQRFHEALPLEELVGHWPVVDVVGAEVVVVQYCLGVEAGARCRVLGLGFKV